jgi:hypothetical protein
MNSPYREVTDWRKNLRPISPATNYTKINLTAKKATVDKSPSAGLRHVVLTPNKSSHLHDRLFIESKNIKEKRE